MDYVKAPTLKCYYMGLEKVLRKAHMLWLIKLQVLVRVLLSLPAITILSSLSVQIDILPVCL